MVERVVFVARWTLRNEERWVKPIKSTFKKLDILVRVATVKWCDHG